MVYSTRRFVLCLILCHFVLVFFSPFSIAITSLGVERANLSAFRTFIRFVLVWICWFPLPLDVLEGLRFVIVALPGLFSYLFFFYYCSVFMLLGFTSLSGFTAADLGQTKVNFRRNILPGDRFFSKMLYITICL